MMTQKFFIPDGKSGNDKNDIDIKSFKTPDEIDAKIDELDKQDGLENDFIASTSVEDDIVIPATPPDKDKEKDDKIIIPDEEEPAKVDADKEKEVVTPDAPLEDKAKTDKAILITDELISNMNLGDEEKKYLDKFKGQPLDAILKSYANAQKLIGKKKEELFKQAEIPKVDMKIPEVKKPEEIIQAKDDLVYSELVKHYPELPRDPQEREKWLADLNYDKPREAKKYLDLEDNVNKEVDTIWQKTEYLRNNSAKINQDIFKSEAESIQNYASKELNLDLKQLGYNLDIDADGNNETLERLLSAENNPDAFDPKVVSEWNGVKIVNKGALVEKFFTKELPNIFKKIRETARKEGIEAKSDKKVIQSLTTQSTKGKGSSKELKADQIKQLNDISKIDELLDQEDAQFFSR